MVFSGMANFSVFEVDAGCCQLADQFFDFLNTVNKELDYVQMEVRGSANQHDGIVYYGIVNKLASEEAKLGTRLVHAQLAFFKAIVSAHISKRDG